MRKKYPVIAKGEIAFLETGTDYALAYQRTLGEQKIAVFCNLTGKKQKIKMGREWQGCEALLENYNRKGNVIPTPGNMEQGNVILSQGNVEQGNGASTPENMKQGTSPARESWKKNLQQEIYTMEPYEFLVLGHFPNTLF